MGVTLVVPGIAILAVVLVASGRHASPIQLRHPTTSQPHRTVDLPLRVHTALRSRRELRRVTRRSRYVPDVLELLTILLRSGATTRQAVQFLALHGPVAVRPAFADVVERLQRGDAPSDALAALPGRLGRDAQVAVDLIGHADRYGLPLVPALEQLGNEARRARQRRAEADARRLPVRLSFPLVVCTLPSFVLLAIAPAVLAALSSLGDPQW